MIVCDKSVTMKPFHGLFRGSPYVLFICIVVTITLTTLTILVSQDIMVIKENGGSNICPQAKFSREMTEQELWPRLIFDLMKRINSSSGPLININVTNIIQPGVNAAELVKLLQQSGVVIQSPKQAAATKRRKNITEYFKPIMTIEEKNTLFETLLKLSEMCAKMNFTYMMYSGTLLGSHRHHDMVPWDDDLDIFMNYTERDQIVAALAKMAPKYIVKVAGARVKFYSELGTQTSQYPWKWPYLDISFFKENATHLWDGSMEDDYGDRFYLYPRNIVFPLHPRPMGNFFFDAPRDSFAHLKKTYGPGVLDACFTSHYSHKMENLTEKVYKIPCESLQDIYPFVHRSPAKAGVRETLMVGKKVVHSMVVQEPTYAITEPFRVQLIV